MYTVISIAACRTAGNISYKFLHIIGRYLTSVTVVLSFGINYNFNFNSLLGVSCNCCNLINVLWFCLYCLQGDSPG